MRGDPQESGPECSAWGGGGGREWAFPAAGSPHSTLLQVASACYLEWKPSKNDHVKVF